MNRKQLARHKENIEKSQFEVERLMRNATDDDEKWMLYGIIRAMLWAIGFILDEMHKGDKNGK